MTVKPTSTLDVEVTLSSAVGGVKTLEKYVEVFQEKRKKPNALVKPKGFIPNITWQLINKAVHKLNGKWSSREQLRSVMRQ